MREAFRSFSQPGSKTIFLKRSARKLYSLMRDQRITAVASYLNHPRIIRGPLYLGHTKFIHVLAKAT